MNEWIEVEDTYLTNQPCRWTGRGKNRRQEPDASVEPTEMFLFCYRAKLTPKSRRVRRKRFLNVLKGNDSKALESQLMDFMVRNDVVLVHSPSRPADYISSGQRPVEIREHDVATFGA